MSQEQIIPVERLSTTAYAKLLSQLPKLGTPRNVEEACTQIGIQMVLEKLRAGMPGQL